MAWAMLKASVLLAVMGKVDVTVEFDEADPRIVRLQRASLFLANAEAIRSAGDNTPTPQ